MDENSVSLRKKEDNFINKSRLGSGLDFNDLEEEIDQSDEDDEESDNS
jgi:hypothetical protein